MRGYESYDRQRHDRRDDGYEEDGYGYEEDGDEYEEEEEEEDAPRPTKEALEFLELRKRLKEQIRRDMKRKEGGRGKPDDRKKISYDTSSGSFFGPSQPVISERVIQESKSLLENQHLVSRVKNSANLNKNSGSTSSASKPAAHSQKPSIINKQNNIVQKRKDTRDYTFLFSDDADLPAPEKDRPPRSVSVPVSERSSQTVMKSKQPLVNGSRPPHGGHDNGRSVHGSHDNSRPVQGSRDNGRPVQGGRDNGRPVQGSRDNGRPVQGSRDSGRPVQGSRDSGRPVQGSRDSGRPVQGSRDSGRPVQGNRDSGRLVQGIRDSGRPSQGSRDSGRPVQGSRDSGRPVQGSRDSGRTVQGSRENGRPSVSGRDERKAVPTNGHIHSIVGSNRPSSASSRLGSTSMDPIKQLGSNNANGPGRPLRPKGFSSQMPASSTVRRVSASGLKTTMSSSQKAPLLKTQPSMKPPIQQRKDVREPYKPNMLSRQSAGVSKHQVNRPQMHKQAPPRPMSQEYRPRKRPSSGFADDEYDPEDGDISSMIRNMFRYDPNKFADDDDVSDMEAGFEDIQREERISERFAIEEDEEQARLIAAEEREERMAAKMRKQKKLKR